MNEVWFDSLLSLTQFIPLLLLLTGVCLGVLIGAIPGLSPSMGVALLIPFTYGMPATLALPLLLAIYIGANYGGSITAITLNTPGTASAVVTAIDGYALTKKNQTAKALGVSVVVSAFAGIIATGILIAFAMPLARIAVGFHPAEYFALAVLGLATVASLAGSSWLKALIALLLGLVLNSIGTDPISGHERFTFGVPSLSDGFILIPALIGLFALSEVFLNIEERQLENKPVSSIKDTWPNLKTYWQLKWVSIRSALIGTLIGIFPGAGAVVASFISYDYAKRRSHEPQAFGQGSLEGVAASEGANSGSVGGAMVPLLTLGIPGSATTAVLIGAMMIHDLTPGPQLFVNRPDLTSTIFIAMLIANVMLLGVGLAGGRLWIKVTRIPKAMLMTIILLMSILGAYSIRGSLFDVYTCVGFGIAGWYMRRHGFPLAPVVLGMVLGPIAESNLRRAVMMDGFTVLFTRPLTLGLLTLAILACIVPVIQARRSKIL